jgi:hypothetical protein
VLSGAHAASGRHVSTWVHAVLSGKVSSLSGDLIHESHDSEEGHDPSPFGLHSHGVSHPGSLPYSPLIHVPV